MLKIYAHGNDLPIVVRTDVDAHYLLGRQLFEWEKTSYPILDLTGDKVRFIYPITSIPLPTDLVSADQIGDDGGDMSVN
jgi:hypothetical protein